MPSPVTLDARIDLFLAAAVVVAAAPLALIAARFGPGPRVALRVLALLSAWVAGWWLVARGLPPVSGELAWMALFLGGPVVGGVVLAPAIRRATAGTAQRSALVPGLVFGFAFVWVCFATVPLAFHAARTADRLDRIAGDLPRIAPAELGATDAPLARLVGATCRADVTVRWMESRRQASSVERRWSAVVGPGWTARDPIPAWTGSCDAVLDVVAIEADLPGRLAREAEAWARPARAVVVTPVTAAGVTAAAYTASHTFRALLASALVAACAAGVLFRAARPGEAAPVQPPAPVAASPAVEAPRAATGRRPGPGWPGRSRRR